MNSPYIDTSHQTISLLGASLFAVTLLCNSQSIPTQKSEPLNLNSAHYYKVCTPSTYDQYSNILGGDTMNYSDPFVKAVTDFYANLLNGQEELGPEFEQILHDNLWNLYES